MIDITIQDEGTIVLLRPGTPEGEAWLEENLDPEGRFGRAFVAEPRYVEPIIDGAIDAGLVVA